jgi:hypothetical protein
MSVSRPIKLLLLVLILSTPALEARADSVLVVEQVNGEAQLDHLGETRVLQAGDELQERDVVRVGEKAYLSLRFTRDGALELGPGAALAIERLPETEGASDLRSIFSLWQGYMHVVWKHPADTRWPLFVYFGGQRSSLVDGEYFFERTGNRNRSCVAAGRMAVTAISGDGLGTLRPSACYEVRPGTEPKPLPRSLEGWVGVRQSFTLDPDPAHPVHAFPAAVPEPADAVAGNTPPAPVVAAGVVTPSPAPPSPPAAPTKPAAVVPAPVVPTKGVAPAAAPPSAIIFTGRNNPIATNTPPVPAAPPTAAAAPAAVPPPPHASASPAIPPPSVAAPVAASVAEAPDSNAGWTILIGSYADPANATQVQQKLASIGLTPFLRVKLVDGKTWNSVQVRGFATREAAEARMAEVSTKLGLPNLRVVLLQ